jgi:hypothetical protein
MKIVKMHTFDCIYLLTGTIKFSTRRKIPASNSVLKTKYQLRSNNSVCAGQFLLLRGRTSAQLVAITADIFFFRICN